MKSRITLIYLFFLSFSFGLTTSYATIGEPSNDSSDDIFDSKSFALEHVMDAHEWHIGDFEGHPITIPLPVLLWDSSNECRSLVTFMSSKFDHGHKAVASCGRYYALYEEKIYLTDINGTILFDKDGHPTNPRPLDFSITKNVASMFFVFILMLLIFITVARQYKKSTVPKGLMGFIEPIILFVRDEIAIPNIGEKKYAKFMPYLLSVFFFIWINNLVGLLPIPPGGGANVTGNIAVTFVLSILTFLITNLYGNKHYWRHLVDPLGNSFPFMGKILIYLILVPVELIGIFTKPFALMIRLFANISAGHIVIISLTSLVFVFKTSLVAFATVPFVLFMNCIELLVAVLQAYIFTLLSALFIGMAVKEHDEH